MTHMKDIEIWRDIPNYEGFYQASNLGNIKSVERYRIGKKGAKTKCLSKILKTRQLCKGYLQVMLSKDNVRKVWLVHRLIAITFLPNENNYKCVDHINGIRNDNRVENLRWCSHSQNLQFPLARLNISKANRASSKCKHHINSIIESRKRPIVIVYPTGKIVEYDSAKDAEKDGFYHPLIAACCNGKQKTHRGCRCYYKSDYYGD